MFVHLSVLQNGSIYVLFNETVSYNKAWFISLIIYLSHVIQKSLPHITLNGSATSYTINYFDSMSNISCGSVPIPVSSCVGGVCSSVFNVSSSCSDSTGIILTVFATNILGNGTESEPKLLTLG